MLVESWVRGVGLLIQLIDGVDYMNLWYFGGVVVV